MARPRVVPAKALKLIVLLALTNAVFGGLRLTLSLKALAMGAGAREVGIVMGLIMLVPALCGHWMGRWTDARGGRNPCIAGAGMVFAGSLAGAFASRLLDLQVASVLVGTGYMLISISCNNAVGRLADAASRRSLFGAVALAFSCGAMLGPLAFGYGIAWVGHGGSFLLAAAGAIVLGGTCICLMDAGPAAARPPLSRGAIALLKDKGLAPVFWANAASSLAWDLFVFVFPIVGTASGLVPAQIGLVLGAFAAGGIAARLLLPLLPRRWGEWSLLRVSFLVSALGYLAIERTSSMLLLMPLVAATGMAAGFGLPVVLAVLHAMAPANRTGEALGIRASITCAGQFSLPIAFGALGGALGFGSVVATAAIVLAMSAGIPRPRRE